MARDVRHMQQQLAARMMSTADCLVVCLSDSAGAPPMPTT
jgi:hypothetical protein